MRDVTAILMGDPSAADRRAPRSDERARVPYPHGGIPGTRQGRKPSEATLRVRALKVGEHIDGLAEGIVNFHCVWFSQNGMGARRHKLIDGTYRITRTA